MIRSRVSLSQEIVLIGESYVPNLWRLTALGDTGGAGGERACSALAVRTSRPHDRVICGSIHA